VIVIDIVKIVPETRMIGEIRTAVVRGVDRRGQAIESVARAGAAETETVTGVLVDRGTEAAGVEAVDMVDSAACLQCGEICVSSMSPIW